jgi:hypothetical protein
VPQDLEERIDALYALPLDRFTPERDALARRLRAEGDRAAADRLKGLRKPVVSAWALNALAREEPKLLEELDGLGQRLRDTQRRMLSGGDASALRDALEERRALVARLVARARSLLEREGLGGSSTEEDVASSLEAAAVDEDAAVALRAGRLTRPMRPPAGFGDTPALTVLPGGRRSAPADDPNGREGERRTREIRRDLAAAEARLRRAEDGVARAQRRLDEADRRRSDARERLREAEAERRRAALEAKRLGAALAKADERA